MSKFKKIVSKSITLFILICIIAVGIFVATPKYTEAKSTNWKKIYHTFLKKHSLDFIKIGYAYIDKNNIPELITYDNAIYTIKKGKVKKIKDGTRTYFNYYWKKGNCFYYQDGDAEGGEYIGFYTIKKGKVKIIKEFDYSGEHALARGRYWRINGKDVSESQYHKELSNIRELYNKKYGKARKVSYKDYTRYHYYNKKTRRYETNTNYAKVTIKGNKLIVIGTMETPDRNWNYSYLHGEKHVFKLTSKTKYIGGDIPFSKNQFKKAVKHSDGWISIETKNGKVTMALVVG